MELFQAINTSGSGLTAEQLRMDVIANNIANVNSTRTPQGGPYRRQRVVFTPREPQMFFNIPFLKSYPVYNGKGVRVVGIEEDPSPFRIEYRPEHPDADEKGYVRFPNVNVVLEMADMITATRAYEANVAAMRSSREMMMRALDISK
ncbi:MAG: flagellar basal body rod protein FlgC [bacterium]